MFRRDAIKKMLGSVVALGFPVAVQARSSPTQLSPAELERLPMSTRPRNRIYRRDKVLKRTGPNEFTEHYEWTRVRMYNLKKGDVFAFDYVTGNCVEFYSANEDGRLILYVDEDGKRWKEWHIIAKLYGCNFVDRSKPVPEQLSTLFREDHPGWSDLL